MPDGELQLRKIASQVVSQRTTHQHFSEMVKAGPTAYLSRAGDGSVMVGFAMHKKCYPNRGDENIVVAEA